MKAPGFISAVAGIALAIASVAPLTANAGIKYWDNPAYKAFDVGDYVPGAIWNYDGIRNVGANAAHDPNALTWANLGTFGSANDVVLQKYASDWIGVSAAELSDGTYGEWTDKGFVFKGNSRFRRDSPGKIQVGTSYTIQFLVDATSAGQKKDWAYLLSVQYDQFALCIKKADGKFYWRNIMAYTAANNGHSLDSFLGGGTFDYGTAIVDGTAKTTAFFSGTKPPTSGDGFRQYDSVAGRDEKGYVIGCTSGDGNQFTGTMKFLRVYDHALTEEEVAWNRVVDEARYFGRVAPLPVTNVVVATAVAGANGTEPAGCYAVDGLHTFTAPATVTVGGIDYVCTGYTVETREGDGWSEPVFHKAAIFQPCAYRVTTDDCVRLTWQWAKAAGLANLGYDASDYVWDDLVLFYDGICNVGTNQSHSYTATTWKNLGSAGATNDMFLQRLNAAGNGWVAASDCSIVGERDPGAWTENGFALKGDSRFRVVSTGGSAGAIDTGTDYSLQMLLDAKAADQTTTYAFPFSLSANKFSFVLYKSGSIAWRNDNDGYQVGGGSPLTLSGASFDYITAIVNGTDNTTAFFTGAEIPTSGSGFRRYDSITAHGFERGYDLGGYGNANYDYLLVGSIKSFRQYSRALTAAEVAQNRKVDNWRYFGIPDNPNIIVQSTVPYLRGDEPDGPYAVDGSHVFTAPTSVTYKGIDYACAGYTVETWGALADKGDGWSAATHYTGNSYSYSTSDGKVRLTWKWKATRGLRAAADYSFADYSQAGIVWNFDGIYNQGVGVERSTTATTWKNLAPNAVTPELFVQRINSGRNNYDNSSALSSLAPVGDRDPGEWTEKGFQLKGDSRWRGLGQVGPVANWTLQTLVDADVNDIVDKIGYLVSVSWSNFAMVLRKQENVPNSLHFNVQSTSGHTTRPYIQNASGKYDYATAILDSSDRTAKIFQGVTPPAGGTIADGYYQFSSSITPFKDTNFGIGASTSYTEYFIGTLKSIRYYDRVLTEEEIVRNRNVDAVRYFGALGVTNVVVEVADGGTYDCNPTPGAYFVEGSYTFTASPSPIDGSLPNKVRVETLAADGSVSGIEDVEGTSYTYVVGTSPAKVRIQFRKKNPFTIIVK